MNLTSVFNNVIYELREVTDEDHAWLVELHNDPIVLHNLNDPNPITMEHHTKWWSSRDTKKDERYIFTVNGQKVGFTKFIQIDHTNQNCLLGADIHKDHRGKGHAVIMWRLMLLYSFGPLGMWRVGLTTAEYNTIAQKVYRNVGFVEEGKLIQSLKRGNEYFDQLTMYMTEPMYRSLHE
jgi:RimJ/RimL family protein N-acetyltransferase